MWKKSTPGQLKRIAMRIAFGLGLYVATFVGNVGVFILGDKVALNVDGDIGDAVAGGAIGWLAGPKDIWRLLGTDEFICGMVWQIVSVVLSAWIAWRVARGTKKDWKVFVLVYIVLIMIIGWVAVLLGAVRWDSHLGHI